MCLCIIIFPNILLLAYHCFFISYCRYLSPHLEINLSGLEPKVYYNLHLKFVTSD